jgi:hypothetical protein
MSKHDEKNLKPLPVKGEINCSGKGKKCNSHGKKQTCSQRGSKCVHGKM